MGLATSAADEAAIRALIGAHFHGMRWQPGTEPDWDRFASDFLPGATLYPAARPVQPKTVEAFIERMNGVATSTLHTFEEHTTGMRIMVFGSVAVVLAGSRMVENGQDENADVSGYLLIKQEGRWYIAAHAWDHVDADKPMPKDLG